MDRTSSSRSSTRTPSPGTVRITLARNYGDRIVDSSIDQGSNEASPDARQDDDPQSSTNTISTSITTRSAPNGQSSRHACEDCETRQGAVPSPAPVFPKSLGNNDKPSKRRSSANGVPTKRLHNDAGDGELHLDVMLEGILRPSEGIYLPYLQRRVITCLDLGR